MITAAPTTSGELRSDEVWRGDVLVEGDVVVPRGRCLRIEAGARVSFAERPRWSCAVFRGAPEGYPIEASYRGRCDLVVLGRLEARGSAEAPVFVGLEGPRWGGITALGSGRVELESTLAGGAEEFVLQAFDDSRLSLSRCRLSGSRIGLLGWGLSRARVADCVLDRLGDGLLLREGARARLERTLIEACVRGALLQHWSELDAASCRFRGCSETAAAAYDRSSLVARDCAFHESGEGILAASRARVAARGCDLWANRIGLRAIESATVEVRGSRVEGSREQGIKFSQSSSGVVRSSCFEGNGKAGVYSEDDARASLLSCELAEDSPAATAGRGVLALSGGEKA